MCGGCSNFSERGSNRMDQKYADLQSLIFHCAAQEMIQDRSQAICTEEDLRNYADNLLRGDH